MAKSDEPVRGAMAASPNRSVERACSIISSFSHDRPWQSLGEIATRVGLPKPTVYRLVSSLVGAGFMSQNSAGLYGLGVKMMEFGGIVRDNLDIVQQCTPVIEEISVATSESVLLASVDWDAMEVMIVARRDSAHPLSVLSAEGRRQPLPPGALGKALVAGLEPAEAARHIKGHRFTSPTKRRVDRAKVLADIDRARELGYAVEEEEFIDGVSGVAVPVVYDGGRPLAAVGVAGPSARLHGRLDEIGRELVKLTFGLRPAGQS